MNKFIITLSTCVFLSFLSDFCPAVEILPPATSSEEQQEQLKDTVTMLTSLIELQGSFKTQIQSSRAKLKKSSSEAEKAGLKTEIERLDKQLSETSNDFERIATGIEPALFTEKKPETFSWKEELSSLAEPAIKELKRFTIRARHKTNLKDSIRELQKLTDVAAKAIAHLKTILGEDSQKSVHKHVQMLIPEYINIEKRHLNKLGLAKLELSALSKHEVSFVESSQKSVRSFFRERGAYLIVAISIFIAILLVFKILYRISFIVIAKVSKPGKSRSFQVRLFDILFRLSSLIAAVIGLFFVLYLAEDWFLLSLAIVFFMGITWTVRKGLPRLWQQGRLMLNIGSVREDERLMLHGVPWRVVSINVFCLLENPALRINLRIPIEDIVGLISRPYKQEEPWFPCKKGDWVVVGNASRRRVVSLSHEQVELVERGGRRILYPTETFLQACPINLSRNFRIRVVFGISYSLQKIATSTIPSTLNDFIILKMEETYQGSCLSLQVEFHQANSSSLDLIVLADLNGQVADISKRIKRSIQKWCVECCTLNGWEIPFPQLTVHKVDK